MSAPENSKPNDTSGLVETLKFMRILLVDDSQVMLSMITKYLQIHDFTNIKTALNGAEALKAAHSWHPDIILTDIQMPVMDGYELCRKIRAGDAMPDIPILFMTGLTKPEDRNAAFAAGASDLISKPVDHLELVGRIRVHLDRRRLIKRLSEYHTHMAQELTLAREMQEAIMPGPIEIDRLQTLYPVKFGSYYRASIGLGGDLWSVHEVEPSKLVVCLVDFSGHGVGSALNTFRFQTFLNTIISASECPSQLLEQANSFLHFHLPRGQFATMFCGLLDFTRERLVYSSASAPPVVMGNNLDGGGFQLLEAAGLPLGLVDHGNYEDSSIDFKLGSVLFMYSDALIETPEPPKSVFTPQSLCELIAAANEKTDPELLIDSIVGHLLSHSENSPNDDLTLVCLNYATQSNSHGSVHDAH